MSHPLATAVGGAWATCDSANEDINRAAVKHGVPANLLKAILNRESSCRFDRDGSRVATIPGRTKPDGSPNRMIPYLGIFETTAATWGCDFDGMIGNRAAQLDCAAYGLARLARDYGGGDFGKAATVYFGGPAALERVFCDEFGMCSDQYTRKAVDDWRALDKLSGGTMAHRTEIPGLGAIVTDHPVEVKLLPASLWTQRPGILLAGGRADRLVQHETGNPRAGAGADMHHRWLLDGARDAAGNPTQTSFHVVTDDRKSVWMIPANEVAWHGGDKAGPCNSDGIAHELCVNADADKGRARSNAERLDAEVLRLLGLTTAALVQHNACSGKDCPAVMRREGYWPTFVAGVARHLAGAVEPPGTPGERAFPWPGDLTDGDAAALFGDVAAADFARGVLSMAWAERFVADGRAAPLLEVHDRDGYRLFQFADGAVYKIGDGRPRGEWLDKGAKG